MKIKNTDAYQSMDADKLIIELHKAQAELSKQLLDMRMKQVKDTNEVAKTKKRIALIETYRRAAMLQKPVTTK